MMRKYTRYKIILFLLCGLASIAQAEFAVVGSAAKITQPVATPHLQAEQIQVGVHYKRLSEKIQSNPLVKQLTRSNANKTQVIMFFSYGCAVCHSLNKPFDEWTNKQDRNKVSICKLPVSFNRGWDVLAQAFFTVKALHKSGPLDEMIFSGVHDKAIPLWVEEKLADLFLANGIDKTLFKNTFHSFSVNSQAKWANDLSVAFELSGVPNIIISGPHGSYVTNLAMTKDYKFLFAVIDSLVHKELKPGIS